MSTFKITNISNLIGKREYKFNSILDIDYVDEMTNKTVKVKPGDSVYLTTSSLPLSVHRLRVKNLVTVVELNTNDFLKSIEVKPTTTVKVDSEAKNESKGKSGSGKKKNKTETSDSE